MQQQGRGLRPFEGKENCIILDHAGNCVRFGLPKHFEVPDLTEKKHSTGSKRKQRSGCVICSSCSSILEPGQLICGFCGVQRPTRSSEVTYIDANLVEFGSDGSGKKSYDEDQKKSFYLGLMFYAAQRGMKSGWAYYAYTDKFKMKPEWKWRYLDPVPPSAEVQRYIQYKNIRYAKSKKMAVG
jgi:superfamily II DNA or RNA helicase